MPCVYEVQKEKLVNSPIDERYTTEYIEREALLVLNFFGPKRTRKKNLFYLDDRDRRIIDRWKKKL